MGAIKLLATFIVFLYVVHACVYIAMNYIWLGSDSLSSGAVAAITFSVTFILTLTAATLIASIITYICVKKKLEGTLSLSNQSTQEKVLYEQMSLPSSTVSKNNVELQPNPAYGASHKVVMDTNPAYESYK